MRKYRTIEMKRLSAEEFRAAEKQPLVVVLDDVRSLYNVGSLFRTADSFRVGKLILCGITATPPHAEIHKTALGAEESVEWEYFPSAVEAVATLKSQGYRVLAVEQAEGSKMLHTLTTSPDAFAPRCAIVLGNEVKGVNQAVVDQCDGCIEIPQLGTKHSLNVSVAGALVIWEFTKQWLMRNEENQKK